MYPEGANLTEARMQATHVPAKRSTKLSLTELAGYCRAEGVSVTHVTSGQFVADIIAHRFK